MFALLPDLDDVLVTFLVEHPALTPLHEGRVGLDLAAGQGPAVRVTSLGGPWTHPWEGMVDYQLEAWGGSDKDANDLARALVATMPDLPGPVAGGTVSSAWASLLPLDSPDPDTGRARRIIQVTVVAHPD